MNNFKNKAQKYGFIFGQFCINIGILIMMFSIPFIANDFVTTKPALNTIPCIVCIIGFFIHVYGMKRCGGVIYEF